MKTTAINTKQLYSLSNNTKHNFTFKHYPYKYGINPYKYGINMELDIETNIIDPSKSLDYKL